MATATVPSSITRAPAVSDVHIIWLTAGLSCDGDSVSITNAEQPASKTSSWERFPASLRFIYTTPFSRPKSATSS